MNLPTGYEHSCTTSGPTVMFGSRSEKKRFSPLMIVTKNIPKNHALSVFAGTLMSSVLVDGGLHLRVRRVLVELLLVLELLLEVVPLSGGGHGVELGVVHVRVPGVRLGEGVDNVLRPARLISGHGVAAGRVGGGDGLLQASHRAVCPWWVGERSMCEWEDGTLAPWLVSYGCNQVDVEAETVNFSWIQNCEEL